MVQGSEKVGGNNSSTGCLGRDIEALLALSLMKQRLLLFSQGPGGPRAQNRKFEPSLFASEELHPLNNQTVVFFNVWPSGCGPAHRGLPMLFGSTYPMYKTHWYH